MDITGIRHIGLWKTGVSGGGAAVLLQSEWWGSQEMWDPVKEELAKEGINLELVTFYGLFHAKRGSCRRRNLT